MLVGSQLPLRRGELTEIRVAATGGVCGAGGRETASVPGGGCVSHGEAGGRSAADAQGAFYAAGEDRGAGAHVGTDGGDRSGRDAGCRAQSAVTLGLVFGERHHLAQLAAGADAGVRARLYRLSRADASPGRWIIPRGFGRAWKRCVRAGATRKTGSSERTSPQRKSISSTSKTRGARGGMVGARPAGP